MVKKATSNLFEEWKSSEEDKALKEQSASFLASGRTAFGNVGGAIKTLGFDPFTSYREAISRGQGRIMFQLQKAFNPLLNQIRWASNKVNLASGDFFMRNAEGVAIGAEIGGTIGMIYPPLAPLLVPLFSWIGGSLGGQIQEHGLIWTREEGRPAGAGPGLWKRDEEGPGYDIFTEPDPTPITMIPKSIMGPGRKVLKLQLSDFDHWM